MHDLRPLIADLYDSVKTDGRFANDIERLKDVLSLTDENILASWLLWDADIREYGNDVYTSTALRMVMHLHNLLPGSWHEKRQETVAAYVERASPSSVCEIGFGTPQRYVRESLARDGVTDILLTDFDESSMEFARALLSTWNDGWQDRVRLETFDMNRDAPPPGFGAYVFQDSLEHADDPTGTLRSFVASAKPSAAFIFSLPVEVEGLLPEHRISWANDGDVLAWLGDGGLEIVDHQPIAMNRNIDLFARSLHPDFHELVILARKPA